MRELEEISLANRMIGRANHCNIINACTTYVPDKSSLVPISKEMAEKALEYGVKIGVCAAGAYHHGSHEGEYPFYSITSEETLDEYLEEYFPTSAVIDPAYDVVKTPISCERIKQLLSAAV